MKLALVVCVALLAVLLQAKDDMSLTTPPAGTRIADGKPAVPRQFPFIAYVKSEGGSYPTSWECVGSLITRNAVLTTAYCVDGFDKFTIRLGSIYRTEYDPNAWTAVATWSLLHPNYKGGLWNVGIIYLPTKAPLNAYIQIIDLARPPIVGSFVGVHGIVSGWGQTSKGSDYSEVLQWAEVTVLPNDICAKYVKKEWVIDSKLCAGGQHVMDGDDGAPLVVKINDRYVQIGIHSGRVRPNYNASRPALYERVTSFIEWITLKTEHQ